MNVDIMPLPGVDVVADFEAASLPFPDDSVEEFHGRHVLEHVRNILPFMQELHRIAKADARAVFKVPYGSSDDADEDPTHVRRYFFGSFGYYGQPAYDRADYGYRGDWRVERFDVVVPKALTTLPFHETMQIIHERRNVIRELTATLRAVKPIRAADRTLQGQVHLNLIPEA